MKKTLLSTFLFVILISSAVFGQLPAYIVSGKVVNGKTGEAVAKASVSFQNPMSMAVYIEPAVTGPDGSYSIKLNEGTYYIIVKHPDFEPLIQKEIKISSDQTMDFKLMPNVPPPPPVDIKNYVMGTVLEKETDQPLPGVSVSLMPTDGRKIYIGTSSDKMGNFALTNIPAGDYYLNAQMAGYVPYKDTTKLTIAEDTKIQDVRITLAKDTAYTNHLVKSIKFFVYKIDAAGNKTGVPNAKIHLMGPANISYGGPTDMNGNFILKEAVPGMYKLMASDGTNTGYTAVDIKTDGQTFEIELKAPVPPAHFANVLISGRLFSASGKPVNEAKLLVYDRTNDRQISTMIKTVADGKYYAAVVLPLGAHELIIGASAANCQIQFYNGKSSLYEADIIKLDISGDKASIDNIDFNLSGFEKTGNYSISGKVLDEQQNPVMGVYVEAFGNFNKSIMAVTDSLGRYSISGLPEGKYFIGFFAKGYMPVFYKDAMTWEKAEALKVISNVTGIDAVIKKTEMYDLKASASGKVSGKISGKDNIPVSGANVILTAADGKVVSADVSDAQGIYSLSGVLGGSYKLIASKVNYQSIESDLNITSDNSGESIYNINLNSSATGISDLKENGLPAKYVLENNYPNPFNPSTRIRFALPEAGRVRIDIYSIIGQKISTLVDEDMNAGYHEASFNAAGLSSGIYIYKMSTENFTASKLMHLLK